MLSRAQTVKGGKAELLYTYIDVEPVVFNRGFYTVDMRFFYRVTLNAYCTNPRPVEVEGLCVFDKRVILFGSEGNAKVFSSRVRIDALDRQLLEQSNMPVAVVEAVDPIVLDAKLVECCENRCCDCDICEIPACVCQCSPSSAWSEIASCLCRYLTTACRRRTAPAAAAAAARIPANSSRTSPSLWMSSSLPTASPLPETTRAQSTAAAIETAEPLQVMKDPWIFCSIEGRRLVFPAASLGLLEHSLYSSSCY